MDELICYFILSLCCLVFMAGLNSGRRAPAGSRPLMSTNVVMMSLFLVYIIMSASLSIVFDNFNFTWVARYSGASNCLPIIALCLFGMTCYVVAYNIFSSAGRRPPTPPRGDDALLVTALISMLILGGAAKIVVFAASGGLAASLTRMSGGLRAEFSADLPDWVIHLQALSGVAEVSATWFVVRALRIRRGLFIASVIFVGVIALAYLGEGKRSLLVAPIVAIGAAYSIYVRPVRLSRYPLFLGAAIFYGIATLFVRIYGSAFVNHVTIDLRYVDWANGSVVAFYFYSLEFAFFEALAVCVYQSDQLISMFDGWAPAFFSTNIAPIFYGVPRMFWPGKPEYFWDLSQGIGALVTGAPMVTSTGGVAASYIGTSWVFGGTIGVVLYSMLLGYVAANNDLILAADTNKDRDANILRFAIVCMLCFTLWRQGSFGFSIKIVIWDQVGLIIGFVILFILSKYGAPRHRAAAVTSTTSSAGSRG